MSRELDVFKRKLRDLTGLDLDHYKEQQMTRRIKQWLDRVQASPLEYSKRLQSDRAERERFLAYLTINTSQFFRDKSVFANLREQVLPALLRSGGRLRIWSAGASIGAEAYSIAILLMEQGRKTRVEIIASDFDSGVLEKAKAGSYEKGAIANVPGEILQEYFRQDGDRYWINDDVKRMVTFRHHNLLADAFFANCDLILCRNVFIYFTTETQHKLIAQFAQALKPGGYFVVGSSEYIADPGKFGLRRVAYCIYQKE